jgi:hypothetical protein
MLLSGISEWVSSIANGVTGALQWIGDEATAGLKKWNQTYTTFKSQLAELQKASATTTAANATRNSLLARAQDISEKAEWVEDQVRTITGWFGLSGTDRQLGILPVIVPAVVIAAIAAVTILIYKWSDDVSSYLREQRATQAGIASGMTPAQATELAQRTNPKSAGIFGDLGGLVWPVALVLGALLLMQGKGSRA